MPSSSSRLHEAPSCTQDPPGKKGVDLTDRPQRTEKSSDSINVGGKHISDRCYFKNSNCHHCGKTGHIAKVCRSKQRESKPVGQAEQRPNPLQHTHQVDSIGGAEEHHMDSIGGAEEQDPYDEQLFNMPCKFSSPLMITVQVNQAKIQIMEVYIDTGPCASIISYNTFMDGWPALQRLQLHQSHRKLRTYTGEELVVEGQLMVEVVYGDQRRSCHCSLFQVGVQA